MSAAESTPVVAHRSPAELIEETLVIVDRVDETDGVASFFLAREDDGELPAWQPGAHIDLEVEPGLLRQYSLCGDPADRFRWRIAVLREDDGRGGSVRLHAAANGAHIVCRGIRNHFELRAARNYLFIAGGIGVTPLIPMIAEAEASGADWRLVYVGRNRRSMAFADALTARYGDRVDVHTKGERGRIDLSALLTLPQADTLIYTCGPEELMAGIEAAAAGWPTGSVVLERFVPLQFDEPIRGESFEVYLDKTGLAVSIPSDRSILACLEDVGVYVVSSCQEGTCGTCETGILEGEVEHRDSILSAEERAANESMMICCSRAISSRIVLDL